jgi:hypothetical protein
MDLLGERRDMSAICTDGGIFRLAGSITIVNRVLYLLTEVLEL